MRRDLTPTELAKKLEHGERLHIVDVRSDSEYASGHVPGAKHVPLETIQSDLPGIAKSETVVLVCRSGMRSSLACEKVAADYDNVYNLVGGTVGWMEAGLSVE